MKTQQEHRDVPGFTGLYEITEDGAIYDLRRSKYSSSTKYIALQNKDYTAVDRKSIAKLRNQVFSDKLAKKLGGKILDKFPNYIIQKDGKIFSMSKNVYLKAFKSKQGNSGKYRYQVTLVDNNGTQQQHRVHRIVAQAFIPNPENKGEINHIDGDPSNNNVNNLEWSTKQENMTHASENYLFTGTQKGVRVTKVVSKEIEVGEYGSMQEASRKLGFGRHGNANISDVCKKNINILEARELKEDHVPYTSGGYVFRYL